MILFYMRALLLLCRPPCLNKHGVTHTIRRVDPQDMSFLSCHDATSVIWAYDTLMMFTI